MQNVSLVWASVGPSGHVNMRCLLHGIILEENTYDPNQETKLNGELIYWRTILEGRVQGSLVQRFNLPKIALKLVPALCGPWTPKSTLCVTLI